MQHKISPSLSKDWGEEGEIIAEVCAAQIPTSWTCKGVNFLKNRIRSAIHWHIHQLHWRQDPWWRCQRAAYSKQLWWFSRVFPADILIKISRLYYLSSLNWIQIWWQKKEYCSLQSYMSVHPSVDQWLVGRKPVISAEKAHLEWSACPGPPCLCLCCCNVMWNHHVAK